jgi:hypothetical protein
MHAVALQFWSDKAGKCAELRCRNTEGASEYYAAWKPHTRYRVVVWLFSKSRREEG